MQHITSNRQHSYKQLVQQAIDYTKANYGDSELSVNQVCSHLHISAGYFSGIFKKEVKLTFVSYLMNLRMEAAKELLLTTELKSFEIAEQVGFSEPNYFSFCFKKQVGISPERVSKSFKRGLSSMRKSIQFIITVSFSLFSVFAIGLLGLLLYEKFSQTEEQSAIISTQQIVEQVSYNLEDYVRGMTEVFKVIDDTVTSSSIGDNRGTMYMMSWTPLCGRARISYRLRCFPIRVSC